MIRVLVWNEYYHEKTSEKVAAVYPNGIHNAIADFLGNEEDTVSYELELLEERREVRRAVALLSPRERELIELRYGLRGGEELTQKEVADMLGISQSYISRLEKRILARLKEEIAGKI